jgi:dihydroceramidase
MTNCVQHGHDRIFLVTFFGYLLVGSGSFAFHSTLKYPMQLVDELSMIHTTCLTVRPPKLASRKARLTPVS